MNAGLAWTVVGSVAGVAAVATGVVIGVLQLRQGRSEAGVSAAVDPSAGVDQGTASAILPPPVGELPPVVRGRDDLMTELACLAEAPDGSVHVLAGLGGAGNRRWP